jgi:transcriptional regulator with XRE-family HTH domain
MSALRTLREAAGLSRSALSIKSKVPEITIRTYETGSRDIRKASYSILAALAEALGCTVDELAQ